MADESNSLPNVANNQSLKSFWAWAKCENSYDRFAPGTAKYRHRFDILFGPGKFRRLRRYKGPGGEVRRTVEIEI